MKKGTYLKLLYALLPIAAAIRTLQILLTINPADGFVYDKYRPISIATSIVIPIVCVILLVLSLKMEKRTNIDIPITGNTMALGSFIASFGMIASSVVSVIIPNKTLNFTTLLSVALDIVMGVLIFLSAYRCFNDKFFSKTTCVVILIWNIAKIILYYSSFDGIIMNIENVFNLLALCTTMIFWLYFAQIVTGYDNKRAISFLYFFGGISTLFCTLTTIPRLIIKIMGNTDLLNNASTISPINLTMIVFIICALLTVKKATD